jgi:predicted DNA-binding transcriptional regulator AlpA
LRETKGAASPVNDPAKAKALLVHLTADELSAIVQDAVKAAMRSAPKEDRLLTVEQVCQILNVSEEWLYHNSRKLPFVRKVGGMLRFSANGIQRYIESAKFTVKGD